MDVVGSPEHVALAKKAAAESIVLLKNEGGLLPLRAGSVKVAVLGPQANDSLVLLGNYHGRSKAGVVTPLQALQSRLGAANASYAAGCNGVVGDGAWPWGDAVAKARAADVALIFVGTSR